MRRREFLRVGAATALSTPALAAPAIAQSQPEIKWRLSSSFPKTLETMYATAQIACRYVAEATDNKFLIQPYQAGELAPGHQALDAASSGSVECAHTPLYYYAAKEPVLSFGTGIPFGLNSRHHQAWLMFGGGAEIINSALKRLNVVGLPAGVTGTQMGVWSKKDIASVDDLKGLRWRISGPGAPVLERIGVAPQQIPHFDVPAAMEHGTIDAAEFICPVDDEKLGLVKHAKSIYYPCWWESGGMLHLAINLERWNALPKSYQSIVARACEAATTWMLAKYDAGNGPAVKRLVAAGAVLKPFPQPVMDAFYRAATEHHAELASANGHVKKALESVNAFRKEQQIWQQVAEFAIDSYMMSLRGRLQ
ncbi:MAG TPA: ABC transporter substrate-binding protein [Hyphomicrobiaceae bacterium]|nr:ABC transporter substrate-binding protein [Hyphomicrobiaceae bacterium]